jgi:hypothetical protein
VSGSVTADVYTCGAMSGLPDFNYPAFKAATAAMRAAGLVVECPTEGGQVEGWEWVDYMRRGITQLLRCRGVATLEGWENSRGARIEVGVALSLGLPVRPVGEWLADSSAVAAGRG